MNVNEVYKHWAADHFNVNVKVQDIDKVEFSHYQNKYHDLEPGEYDTFNGSEMWSMTIHLKDGSTRNVNLWDSNPASSIAYYTQGKGWTIEFDPPEPPTTEELIEIDLRRW